MPPLLRQPSTAMQLMRLRRLVDDAEICGDVEPIERETPPEKKTAQIQTFLDLDDLD